MTITTDIAAITLTANAKAASLAAGANSPTLMAQLLVHVGEKQRLLKQILAFRPSTGGDAANWTAINAILAKL
jgi:hypothetical protein